MSIFHRQWKKRTHFSVGSGKFVDADASVAEWRFSGEGHHGGKYSAAHFPAHVFVAVFMSDKRPCMEAKVWKAHPCKGLVDEYAQSRIFVHAYKARAAGCPPLKAKNFLRVSVTPAFQLSSPCMISNLSSVCKGADFGFCGNRVETNERKAALMRTLCGTILAAAMVVASARAKP